MSPSPPATPQARAALAAAALAVWAALGLAVALAGLERLAPASQAPAAAAAWLWTWRDHPEVRLWLARGAAASSLVLVAATALAAEAARRPLHGAARWAGEADIRKARLRARRGIVLGRQGGRLLVFGGPEHVALYAPTRTGKGVGVVIPNLLTWPDSVVVLDIKRENWDATAGFRAARGQAVFLFDPLDPEGRTARFNPLGHIERSDPVAVVDELQRIAAMLFPAPAAADPFWAESARTGFVGVGAYLAETPELPFDLGTLYAELVRGDPRTRFPRLAAARKAEGRPLSAGAVRALTDFCSASENTFASIRQTLTSRLNLWLNPRVCAATAASDFDLRTLRDRPTSIYLATSPENLSRVAPLYNLLLQQLVDGLCRERPSRDRPQLEVLVLLDEFARLGHASVLAKGFAYVAGYGLRMLPVLQSPAQLRGEYGADLAEEILANCAVEVVFAPKGLRLAAELSERLGYATVRSAARTRPAGLAAGRRTLSETDQRRALMLPQELMRLPSDRLIVLKAGAPPVLGRKIAYYRDPTFARRVVPPPIVAPIAAPDPRPSDEPEDLAIDPLALAALAPAGAADLAPPPDEAPVAEVEAWVARFIDAAARAPAETRDAR
ncbi:type IV secretory system conjugative DNA transfer family protein [Phenylobacterium sp.]|jgi:type IV secretion system protein VirD4|uniref:type IV secretory system conjugative DNA transfer family protein n=1 Tax=Phenylobacterium sp. TaxID=1871053 RepID=UPI002F9587B6